eukprot:4649026-Alexandrium_andersonii.AAC.1
MDALYAGYRLGNAGGAPKEPPSRLSARSSPPPCAASLGRRVVRPQASMAGLRSTSCSSRTSASKP